MTDIMLNDDYSERNFLIMSYKPNPSKVVCEG